MTLLLSIIAFVVIFSAIILIHEFGHFYVARKSGIKVLEFGLGMPPRIWGFKPKKSETTYTINAIPFGGFVRLYGEDVHDKKALRSKRSYVSKSPLTRIAVAIAGVTMNFILAWLLLTIGFTVGIQPLFVNQADVFQGIDDGVVVVENGLKVKAVNQDGLQISEGSVLKQVNSTQFSIEDNPLELLQDGKQVTFQYQQGGKLREETLLWSVDNPPVEFYDLIYLPNLVVYSVNSDSVLAQQGLESGDIISQVDNEIVFDAQDVVTKIGDASQVDLQIIKDPALFELMGVSQQAKVVITDVLEGTPAEEAGIFAGDAVLKVNDRQINSISDLQTVLANSTQEYKYTVERFGNEVNIYMEPDENGLVGILMSELVYEPDLGITYFQKVQPASLIEIKDISYPVYYAPIKALEEMWRISVLTVEMLGQVVLSVFTQFAVPDGVAGPVGIAQLTYVFVQEGLLSLIRFAALLSLSLAIINILPFPGLDGGRILLIILPLILGKKLDSKIEGMIHVIGFLFLMGLILLITFNDILRLFGL